MSNLGEEDSQIYSEYNGKIICVRCDQPISSSDRSQEVITTNAFNNSTKKYSHYDCMKCDYCDDCSFPGKNVFEYDWGGDSYYAHPKCFNEFLKHMEGV